MKVKSYLILVFILFFYGGIFAKNIPRNVIVLLNFQEDLYFREDYNPVHKSAETVLNYLGMNVIYHDISQGLPSSESMSDVHGIISYFTDEKMPQASDYCHWLMSQIDSGKKFILWNNLGAHIDSVSGKKTELDLINELLDKLGIKYIPNWNDNPFSISIRYKDPDIMDFERNIDNELSVYDQYISLNQNNKIYLKIYRTNIEDSDSDVVLTAPSGGFIGENMGLMTDPTSNKKQWYIDPFIFFAEALQIEQTPRYDTTTLFGNRIFYSHIDGDGILNGSKIEKYKDKYSGLVILEEIIKKYPLPISASFITADISPEFMGNDIILNIAKDIARLDNIEIGAHGFSHPLDWNKKLTTFAIANYSKSYPSIYDEDIQGITVYKSGAIVTVDKKTFLETETLGALDYIQENIAPANKKVTINQWTGNCSPPAEAIEMVEKSGFAGINGGDSRFDILYPSYTAVAPLFRQVNGAHQVYASSCNENIYTNGWLGPFDGFRHVIQSYQQTEKPTFFKAPYRRITPINVYYHFFTGEREASLNALKEVYNYSMQQEIVPIHTSEYCHIVKGFLNGKIEKDGFDSWILSDYNSCRSVRFDHITYPDLDLSKNILGFYHWQGHTFIHLNESERSHIYLKDTPPEKPYLSKASANIYKATISNKKIKMNLEAFKNSYFKFKNMLPSEKYYVEVFDIKGSLKYKDNYTSDRYGNLNIAIKTKGKLTLSAII